VKGIVLVLGKMEWLDSVFHVCSAYDVYLDVGRICVATVISV